jgi:hypothetical protein
VARPRSQRLAARRGATRALRKVFGMNRAQARRAAYAPSSDFLDRQARTRAWLAAATAHRWGIPTLAEKDGAVV